MTNLGYEVNEMTRNRNHVNLLKFALKNSSEIASSELIFGGFHPFGTSVRSTAVAVASIEKRSAEDGVCMSEQSRVFRGRRGH